MKEKTVLETYEEKRELAQEFNLIGDLFASKVFEDVDACQELCRILLRDQSVVLQSVRTQYYLSGIDMSILEKGKDYGALPSVTMVYLTKEDIVGGGRGCDLVERKADGREKSGDINNELKDMISISNGVKERYYNLEHPAGDEKVDELLQYFKNSDPYYKTETFPRIVERVKYFKIHNGGVDIMREISDRIRNEGKIEGMVRAILELLDEFGQVPQQIVELVSAEDNLGVLSRWLKSAAKAGSIAEFEANM